MRVASVVLGIVLGVAVHGDADPGVSITTCIAELRAGLTECSRMPAGAEKTTCINNVSSRALECVRDSVESRRLSDEIFGEMISLYFLSAGLYTGSDDLRHFFEQFTATLTTVLLEIQERLIESMLLSGDSAKDCAEAMVKRLMQCSTLPANSREHRLCERLVRDLHKRCVEGSR